MRLTRSTVRLLLQCLSSSRLYHSPIEPCISLGLPVRYQVARLMPRASQGRLTFPPSGGFLRLSVGDLVTTERRLSWRWSKSLGADPCCTAHAVGCGAWPVATAADAQA